METHEHFSAETLLDYLEQRADERTAAQVQAHLDAGCVRCAAELAHWARLVKNLSADRLLEPPEAVMQRVLDLPDREVKPSAALRLERDTGPLRSSRPAWVALLARLVIDSRAQPAPAGARESLASYQMLFEADGTDIDLLCKRGEDGWRITGQALTGDTPEPGWIVAAAGTDASATTETDDRGEFRFSRLPPGLYQLILRGPDREVVLPNVRLGEPPS